MSWAWAASRACTISMPKPAPSEKKTANWGMAVKAGSVILVDRAAASSSAADPTSAYVAANPVNSSSLRLGY